LAAYAARMLQELEGKVAVVTGAGGGIGEALCRGFAAEGMRVVVVDIDASRAQAVAASLPEAISCAVDVADGDAVARLADDAFAAWGQVDVLCNNAGVFQGGLSWERSVADWDWVLGVNLYGIIHAIRSFVPRMVAQGTDGHIVNTASVAAFVAGAASSPYVVSKCAAFSLTECLALDLGATSSKIGVSVLTPSSIDTGIAHTAAVRPERFGRDDTPDGAMVAQGLAAITGQGIAPSEVVAPVLAAIRSGEFLIPTKPSYAAQVRNRFDALLERRLPAQTGVD
jgi:NAD(P)-dependent dehydrogenase (short-subunit alcohol dehydrogenase family)